MTSYVERDADRLGDYQDHQACGHQDHHQEDHQDRHQGVGRQDSGADRHQGVGRHQGVDHQDLDANRQDLDAIQEDQGANPQEQCAGQDVSQPLDAVVEPIEDHPAVAELLDPWTKWAAAGAELGVPQETTGDQEPGALAGDPQVDAHRVDAVRVGVPPAGVLEQPGWAATK